jgi:DNA-binding response OmpR family regulator
MADKKILLVDDDDDLRFTVAIILELAGYEVFTAANGEAGIAQFENHSPDLVLLDIMMPHMDGWEVCRKIRQRSNVPILMLTALGADSNIVQGLECGGDDYLVKPFSNSVLLARISALLRRAALPAVVNESTGQFDDGFLRIDLPHRKIAVNGQETSLTRTEWKLLGYMLQNHDRILEVSAILNHVWGKGYEDSTGYVHDYVARLRRKIEPNPKDPQYIISRHGVGYRFSIAPPHE